MNTNEHENFRRCRQKRLPEPLNRSRRRESALILCRESKQVRRLTSAATRFRGSLHDSRIAPRDHERWGETPSSPDLQLDRNRALDGVSPHRVNEEGQPESCCLCSIRGQMAFAVVSRLDSSVTLNSCAFLSMRFIKPLNALPGPNSMKRVNPCANR